jgi:hypothetical protein
MSGKIVKGGLRTTYWTAPSSLFERNFSFSNVSTDVRGPSAVILYLTYIYHP